MVNNIAPAAVIFVNAEISDNVKSIIAAQLFVSEAIGGAEFDARLATDPNYLVDIYGNDLRILVFRAFSDLSNRDKADIALFYKNGLLSVEKNKFGPPGISFPLERAYLSQLIYVSAK